MDTYISEHVHRELQWLSLHSPTNFLRFFDALSQNPHVHELVGIYAGSIIVALVVADPFWRGMSADDALHFFQLQFSLLDILMPTLTIYQYQCQ